MKRIILPGPDSVALATVMHSIQRVVKDQIEFILIKNAEQDEEVKNKLSKPEPFILENYRYDFFIPKHNDIPRNKFFNRPRNNFRKR